ERVIQKLTSKTNPVSADRLLIVTFTNAAAAEMRSRIERRLDEECRKNPYDTGLMYQKYMLPSAKICTIDSFCIDLVRENFEKVGVSPDFSISDGYALRPINEQVMSRIIDRYLKENNPVFNELLDIIGAEYDEKKFLDFVLSIYEYSRQLPYPKKWFESLPEYYENGVFGQKNIWRLYAINRARETFTSWQRSISNAVDLVTVNQKAADKYLPCFVFAAEKINELLEAANAEDFDGIFNKLSEFSLPNLPRVNGVSDICEIKAAKDIYKYLKEKAKDKLCTLFYAPSDFINSQFKKLYEPIKLLSEILIEFDTAIFEEYLAQNTFTFHNTEHLALSFLCEEKDGVITVRPGAEEFLNRYDEVCVDEYQDTNDLQNMLFYVLSGMEKKLFAVGDVKQSIYRFRGANPKNFLHKKDSYLSVDMAYDGQPKKIILGENFRCRPEVCDFANYFFSLFMNKQTGDIEYNDEEKLIPRAVFPEIAIPSVSMDIINASGDENNKIILEARQIAAFIKKTMDSGDIIRVDEKTLRKPKYSDFTILLRSMKNKAALMAGELKRMGIPVNYNADGFAEFTEIAVMLSILKVIDNPCSDVELLSVMMSPIFGFTAEEIANLRIEKRDGNLYSAVSLAAKNGDKKVKAFLKTIEKFRLYAVTNTLPKLLQILLEETEFLDTVSALPDGSRRKNNLLLLCEYAKQYAGGKTATISGFVNYIAKQSESGIKSAVADSGEDTVRIMSIHASKGLQFPVCIIADTASDFYISESRQATIYTTDFGIGFKYYDENDKTRYTTIAREAILDKIQKETLEEELRLFYVAMTRTQDILHFTGTVSNLESKIDGTLSLLLAEDCKITSGLWNKTKSYFDWMMIALMLHPSGKELRGNGTAIICRETESKISVNIIDSKTIPDYQPNPQPVSAEFDEQLAKAVRENIAFKYPYEELLSVESKASVSAIANKAESEKYAFSNLPSFMSDGGITASGRGTAMHKVMEFFDFSKWQTPKEEIARLREWQFISETEAEAVNIPALEKFFKSDIFKRISKAKTVKREMRFLTELPATRIAPQLNERFKDEKIIVQGAVDVCFVEEDGVVILDFKTDRTDDPNSLKQAYGEQLNIYA
ncbi:MAG: helicase-exonuclease AddAB subunit AddA, partial [Acutalibacteraceae bacterium]